MTAPDVSGRRERATPLPPALPAGSARPGRSRSEPRSAVGQHGSQSLELALALPIVALLGVGVLLAGMVGVEATAVHAAAREAARAAAAGEDVRQRLATTGLAEAAIVRVDPPPALADPGEAITVEVSAPSRVLAPLGAAVELRARAAAAREPSAGGGP